MKELITTDLIPEITEHPLQRLDYFMEWGATTWQHLMTYAIEHFLGTSLRGKQVLDIGTRYGKMACLFALLDAKVIGLDLNRKFLSVAQEEAEKWNVIERIAFLQGSGDLSIFKDKSFDVIFSKSVLVVVPDLAHFLLEINAKLKPGGKIIFLENAKGPWLLHFLRRFRHGRWDYTKAQYFTKQELGVVSDIFDEVIVRKRFFPPVILIMGYKRG